MIRAAHYCESGSYCNTLWFYLSVSVLFLSLSLFRSVSLSLICSKTTVYGLGSALNRRRRRRSVGRCFCANPADHTCNRFCLNRCVCCGYVCVCVCVFWCLCVCVMLLCISVMCVCVCVCVCV